jgi:hypothetical protein
MEDQIRPSELPHMAHQLAQNPKNGDRHNGPRRQPDEQTVYLLQHLSMKFTEKFTGESYKDTGFHSGSGLDSRLDSGTLPQSG